ncbi:MAG TPA: LysR substrate-binding domain-containing protein [Sphingobium sp.]
MKLSQIRDVLAVAKAGSLRAAGRELGVAQPSITRSIRDIERELCVSLFTRRASGVVLTEMGEIFVRRATAIENEVRRVREELAQAQGNDIGQVSVAMTAASSISVMPAILAAFGREHPHAVLKFSESLFRPIEKDIHSGEIDFYVGPLDEESARTSLHVEKLFENERMVIARRGHPLDQATTLAELGGARWIRPSSATRSDEGGFEQIFASAGLPQPEIVMHSRSALMTLLAVVDSDLLTVLPSQWLEFGPTAGSLARIPLTQRFRAAPVCIVRRGDLPLTPLAERLCDIVRRAALNYDLKKMIGAAENPISFTPEF